MSRPPGLKIETWGTRALEMKKKFAFGGLLRGRSLLYDCFIYFIAARTGLFAAGGLTWAFRKSVRSSRSRFVPTSGGMNLR